MINRMIDIDSLLNISFIIAIEKMVPIHSSSSIAYDTFTDLEL